MKIFVDHFTGGPQADSELLGRALAAISVYRDFEALGRAMYRTALRVNLARLRDHRAELVAEVDKAEGREPPLSPSVH